MTRDTGRDILYKNTAHTFSTVEQRDMQQPSERLVLEDPFYYLANFRQLVEWIHQRYVDLLSP